MCARNVGGSARRSAWQTPRKAKAHIEDRVCPKAIRALRKVFVLSKRTGDTTSSQTTAYFVQRRSIPSSGRLPKSQSLAREDMLKQLKKRMTAWTLAKVYISDPSSAQNASEFGSFLKEIEDPIHTLQTIQASLNTPSKDPSDASTTSAQWVPDSFEASGLKGLLETLQHIQANEKPGSQVQEAMHAAIELHLVAQVHSLILPIAEGLYSTEQDPRKHLALPNVGSQGIKRFKFYTDKKLGKDTWKVSLPVHKYGVMRSGAPCIRSTEVQTVYINKASFAKAHGISIDKKTTFAEACLAAKA
jgi:hypothetical protein